MTDGGEPIEQQVQRGRYIALEGIEGAGKSTIARLLADGYRAAGIPVATVREPGGTGAGERVREILLDPDTQLGAWGEALLFAAARAELARERVGPALDDGTWVISDRSVYSSLAYQGGGRGLGIDRVRAINEPGLEGVWPDLVVVLCIEPEAGLARQEIADRIGAEGVAFQRRVADAFEKIMATEPERVVGVDAAQPIDRVVAAVAGVIAERWGDAGA